MNPRTDRELRELLRDVARGELGPAIAARAQALLDRKESKETTGPKKKTEQLGAGYAHAKTRRAIEEVRETFAKREMHDAVFAWNREHTRGPGAFHGRCDCGCGGAFKHAADGECDHWIERSQGGEHTRANGWRLLSACHDAKTNNRPPPDAPPGWNGRREWNARRERYCARAGIPFVPRREK